MDPRGSLAAPKGILKNRSRDDDGRYNQNQSYESGQNNSSWDYPQRNVSAGNGGIGIVPQKSDVNEGGLDRSLRRKLNEFISRKGELLFRPLSTDEVPLKDENGTHLSTQDHYGVVPSLDFFLRLDPAQRRRHFFNSVQPGEVLIAKLTSKTLPGLHFQLVCMEGGRGLLLEDLEIEAFCPTSQMVPPIDSKNPNRIYANGDMVRCEVLKVSVEVEKLVVGMKGNALSPEMQHSYELGLVSPSDLPTAFTVAMAEKTAKSKKSYEELIESSSGFQNPNNIVHLAASMGILSHKSTLMAGLSGVFPAKEMAKELRRVQNGKWAHGSVAEGIRYFKMGNYVEAFQCLNKALSIDAENVEGLVARGALYANKANFEKAIEDFESALRFNPSHYNAKKYLAETLVAYGKQQEVDGNIEDAIASYSKCLAVRPDHSEAKNSLWALYARTEKLDPSKMNSTAASKTIELKEKLKTLLQSDLPKETVAVDTKTSKTKKTKREKKSRKSSESDENSSSSSSSESDSDSSSSESDSHRGRKKKKSRKRKSKKSKKSKKEHVKEKEKEVSLSPFSKRLAAHGAAGAGMGYPGGSDLIGFNESTYTEWGKQIGIEKQPSEEGDQKKSKSKKKSRKRKEKRKKKKHDSEDSSSRSDSSEPDLKDLKKKKKSASVADNISSVQSMLPDLGDLEAKLSAYYSKVEQEKAAMTAPIVVRQPIEPSADKYARETRDYESRSRKLVEVQPKERGRDRAREVDNSSKYENLDSGNLGKIQLRTDEYGNYIHPEKIVRTVVNDTAAVDDRKPKFEMKFRTQAVPAPPTAVPPPEVQDNQSSGAFVSKWRTVGVPAGRDEPYIVTRLDGSTVVRRDDDQGSGSKPSPVGKSTLGIDRSIPNPLDVDGKLKGKEEPRNYRGRKSRSRSRSRSRTSPRRRNRRSASRSRSKGRRSSRSSNSRSRSRSPAYRSRRSFGNRGRARFFRGYRSDRGGRGFFRGNTRSYPSNNSRMRNVFRSRSKSRSRSRGRYSKSQSPRRTSRRSRSHSRDHDAKRSGRDRERKDDSKHTSEKRSNDKQEVMLVTLDEKGEKSTDVSVSTSEIQIGSLTTTKAKDVEELLDQRNAQKKEEMRERNPDFFRT